MSDCQQLVVCPWCGCEWNYCVLQLWLLGPGAGVRCMVYNGCTLAIKSHACAAAAATTAAAGIMRSGREGLSRRALIKASAVELGKGWWLQVHKRVLWGRGCLKPYTCVLASQVDWQRHRDCYESGANCRNCGCCLHVWRCGGWCGWGNVDGWGG
jgi:hypothetical protein